MSLQKRIAAAMGHAALAGARRQQTDAGSSAEMVVLANGLRLDYREQGDPAGPAVLLLHGYSDSWRSWEPLLAQLPERWRVFAISQRGHGDSDRPASYAMAEFAEDAALFLEAMGLREALVVGHSMGALVAECLAIRHPARVAGLCLINGFASFAGNAEVQALWHEEVAGMADPVDPVFVRAFQRGTLARPVPAAFLEAVVAESLKLPAQVWREALAGMLACDVSAQRARIACPALLVWGDRDLLVPREEQETMLAALRDARLQVLAGSGHAPHWESPATVAALLTRFVAAAAATNRRR